MKLGKKRGSIEVVCGPMYCGKTEELIRRVTRAKIAKQETQVFKHEIDLRYNLEKVASHSKMVLDATPVKDSQQILEILKSNPKTEVAAIDEAQFFDMGLPNICNQLAEKGLRVIVVGLDTNFRGEPFGPMPTLLAIAEKVDKLSAVCIKCGKPATRSQRLINGKPASYSDKVVIVGAKEIYEARCRHCHVCNKRSKTQKRI